MSVSRRGFLTRVGGAAGLLSVRPDREASRPGGPPPGEGTSLRRVTLRVNGARHRLELEPRRTLADVIRKELGLTGTKVACDRASCGSCTVLVSGRAVFACHLLAIQVHELDVLTIEGLAQPGRLHPIQSAFISQDAAQCGFCTPGMILTLKAALDRSPLPDRQQLRHALAGNICRCGAYNRILDAAERVARGEPED